MRVQSNGLTLHISSYSRSDLGRRGSNQPEEQVTQVLSLNEWWWADVTAIHYKTEQWTRDGSVVEDQEFQLGVGKELSTSQTEETVLRAILKLIFFNASFRMTIIVFICTTDIYWALTGLPWWLSVKNPPANAGDIWDVGSILGSGRPPGGGHGNPLQDSCLENPTAKEPGGLQSMGSQRAGHDWSDLARTHALETRHCVLQMVSGQNRTVSLPCTCWFWSVGFL